MTLSQIRAIVDNHEQVLLALCRLPEDPAEREAEAARTIQQLLDAKSVPASFMLAAVEQRMQHIVSIG